MPPTSGNGKICYIEIPATAVSQSADFYHNVFGWNIRRRGDGSTAFDDGVGGALWSEECEPDDTSEAGQFFGDRWQPRQRV